MTGRVLASYLFITVFTLLVLEIPLAVSVTTLQTERLTSDLQRDALVLATLYEDALDHGAPFDAGPAVDYVERSGGRVVVVDRLGRSIVDTDGPVGSDLSGRPEVADALAGITMRPDARYSQTLGEEILYVAAPVASGGQVHGAVRITFDPAEADAAVRRYRWGLVAIGVVVLACVALVGWLVARSVTRPLRDIRTAALAAGAGDLSVRIDPGEAPSEIRELAQAFNATAGRLEDLIDRQRTFVADASHELRTPLTALRLRLENLADEVPAGQRDEVGAALTESERLAQLVEDLLALARAESGRRPVETIDVARAVGERTELWRAVAEEEGKQITSSGVDGPAVHGRVVPGAVEQVVDNLLSNALAVTPHGAAVDVSVVVDADAVEIHVVDRGPGLSDEALGRAFDRFWRGSQATSGTGLGLAIVKQLVEASGGTAQLRRAGTGGLEAVVRLPAGHRSSPGAGDPR